MRLHKKKTYKNRVEFFAKICMQNYKSRPANFIIVLGNSHILWLLK